MSNERRASVSSTRAALAGRREWLGLSMIALPCLLYSMDLTVLDLALPSLARALHASSSELLWIVDIYGFVLAGSLITMGMLGDRVGRRRVLLFGAAGFGAASILSAFSASATTLILARGLLGIAGATVAPSTLSLIRSLFADRRERTFAIGIWATSFSLGAALGPLAGGLLLERFWWGSAFLIGVPITLLLLVLGPSLLPEVRVPRASPVDWVSAVLSALGVLPIIYGIKRVALGGSAPTAALCVLAGAAFVALFFYRQRALAEPLVDLALFREPTFAVSLTTYALTLFTTFGSFLLVALYLQQVKGLSPLAAGLCAMPGAGGFVVGSMLAPQLVKRFEPAHVVTVSLLLAAGGLLVLTQLQASSSLPWVVSGSVLLALGAAPAVTLVTDLVVASAPEDRAGAASALSETCGEFGGALGVASLGTLVGVVYRARMQELRDIALPATDAARDTLSGALALSERLPRDAAQSLLVHARHAFVEGMHLAALISALVLASAAALVFARLGRQKPRETPHAQPHCTSSAPGVQNSVVPPQMHSQLGVPMQAAGRGAQLGFGGGPASSGAVPLHGARQYSFTPHLSSPQPTPIAPAAPPAACPPRPPAPPLEPPADPALPPAPPVPAEPPDPSHGQAC